MRTFKKTALCFATGSLRSSRAYESSTKELDAKNKKKRNMHFGIDSNEMDLGLNFDKMDFTAVVNATREAIRKENADKSYRKNFPEKKAKTVTGGGSRETLEKEVDSRSEDTREMGGRRGNSYRGIVESDIVDSDGNFPSGANLQHEIEKRLNRNVRYTLAENLKDCSLSNNWMKALGLFNGAVETSAKFVLTPSMKSEEGKGDAEEEQVFQKLLKEKESQCFDVLRKMMVALPPPSPQRSNKTEFRKNMRGVLRWNSKHLYLLLKTLLECGRVEEVGDVWNTTKRIGFVDYHLDEFAVNHILSLVRRFHEDLHSRRVRNPLLDLGNPHQLEVTPREKEILRGMVVDLDTLSTHKHFKLNERNRRTIQAVRLANTIANTSGEAVESELSSMKETMQPIKMGDFVGLLRASKSHSATMKIIDVMEKMGASLDASALAGIIASLHQPGYLLEGYTEGQIPEYSTSHDPLSKQQYEEYKTRRIQKASEWFSKVPPEERNPDLYNQMLYLLRSKPYRAQFNELLTKFRGNTLRDAQSFKEVTIAMKRVEDGKPIDDLTHLALLPPQWSCPPNGRTYDLLIHVARYENDWFAVWDLFYEMKQLNINGTEKLYNLLIREAHRYPPSVYSTHKDVEKAVSKVILDLYKDAREKRMDVTSLSSTLNLVNAWSAERGKKPW